MPTLPSIAHSPESRQAAAQAAPTAGTKRAAVLRFIASRGHLGATDDEVQLGLGMNPSTERPRRIELYEGRHIAKLRATRTTRTGRKAVVWIDGIIATAMQRSTYKLWPEE
jgi:hypothetical protein